MAQERVFHIKYCTLRRDSKALLDGELQKGSSGFGRLLLRFQDTLIDNGRRNNNMEQQAKQREGWRNEENLF